MCIREPGIVAALVWCLSSTTFYQNPETNPLMCVWCSTTGRPCLGQVKKLWHLTEPTNMAWHLGESYFTSTNLNKIILWGGRDGVPILKTSSLGFCLQFAFLIIYRNYHIHIIQIYTVHIFRHAMKYQHLLLPQFSPRFVAPPSLRTCGF